MKIVVTRPRGQQHGMMQALAQAGYVAIHQPALAIQPLDVDDAMRRRLMDLDLYHAVFFVSANAAKFGLAAMADVWPQWPVGIHWLAVGEGTARVLRGEGMIPEVPQQGFNSEAVLALPCLQQIEDQRILICRGQHGREWLANALRARGANVDVLPLYRRDPLPWQGPSDAAGVLITSCEGAAVVAPLLAKESVVIAAGQRVATAVKEYHQGQVVAAKSAHDGDMLMALKQALPL